jgi:hypothetical protein
MNTKTTSTETFICDFCGTSETFDGDDVPSAVRGSPRSAARDAGWEFYPNTYCSEECQERDKPIRNGETDRQWAVKVSRYLRDELGQSRSERPTQDELREKIERRSERKGKDRLLTKPSLRQRFENRILNRYVPEIEDRGGETEIEEEHGTESLGLADYEDGLYLLRCEGYRYYSSRTGSYKARLAYLCGTDDSGEWAVRVPGTTETVEGAVEYVTPRKVQKAREEGKHVKRQGDVYLVETSKAHDGSGELPDRHTWDEEKRKLYHDEANTRERHQAVYFPWPVCFVPQKSLEMGRQDTSSGSSRSGFVD